MKNMTVILLFNFSAEYPNSISIGDVVLLLLTFLKSTYPVNSN